MRKRRFFQFTGGLWQRTFCLLCVLSMSLSVMAQKRTVTGTVLDASGEPIIGANVVESGTTNGNITDTYGKFTLSVNSNAVLQVSYVGYITQNVAIGNQSTLTITLAEDTQALEEVVVIGYGTAKKSDLVGAVSQISARKFSEEPVTQFGNILQGRVAGVQVMSTGGQIGSGPKVRIRGATSLNKGNDPLYVVDGIIGGGSYNLSDVESVEVLKDASSTAIYGSRGANGVVLITTKKGKAGKPTVSFQTEQGISTMPKYLDLLNAYEYAQALNAVKGSGTISEADMAKYKSGELGIDWQDLITQTGHTQDYFLTVQGGSETSKYFISSEILDQTGLNVFSSFKRYLVRANLDNEITKWFHLTTDIRLQRTQSGRNDAIFETAVLFSPTMLLRDPETGRYNRDPFNSIDDNPYAALADGSSVGYNNNVNGYVTGRFDIIDGLSLSITGALNYGNYLGYGFNTAMRSPSANSSMSNSTSNSLSWQNTNNLEYKKQFGDHYIDVNAIWELTSGYSSSMSISGSNLLTETVGYWNIGLAANKSESNGYSESSMASAIGRIQYNYQSKYFLSASIRADGSSHFQGDNKWGYFPTVGVGWQLANEDFMKDQTLFQRLKIYGNIGQIGNQGIGSYETLGMLTNSNYYYGTSTRYTGYWAATIPTPDITWEKTNQYDLGFDIGMLKNRLNIGLDFYVKDTKDLLNKKMIPYYMGGGSFWVNQGRVKNTGFDLMLDVIPVDNQDFGWESTLTATYVKNKVLDLAGEDFILGGNLSGSATNSNINRVGYPINSFYVYEWSHIDPETGVNVYWETDRETGKREQTTDPDPANNITTGQPDPAWTLGWNNTLRYKDFDFNIFFNGAFGHDRLNFNTFMMSSIVGSSMFINLRDAWENNWDNVANKADAKYQSLKGSGKIYGNSTQFLEDASFIKLKNVSIGYTVPRKFFRFGDIKLTFSAQNLFCITKYTGYDPEALKKGYDTTTNSGIDWGAYPNPRSYTLGLKVSF